MAEIENQRYMQEGLDVRRVFLLMKKKLWVAAAAAAIGAFVFGGIYLLVHVVFAPAREFQSVSKLYLNFNCDPEDFNELSYNGYTWNDLMATDPILDYTMEALPEGMDREVVIGATKAEILSDIRLLTITVTASEPEMAAQIMAATQKSLVHLGETDVLFDSIEVYSTKEPRQIVWDNRTVQAAATGAVIGLAAALMALAFCYVLDDSVYIAGDVEKRYGVPVLGIFVDGKEGKEQPYGQEFALNYSYLCREAGKVLLVGLDAEEDAQAAAEMAGACMEIYSPVNCGIYPGGSNSQACDEEPAETVEKEPGGMAIMPGGCLEGDADVYRRIREADGAVIAVRSGGRNGRRLERALGNLEKQDCRVFGAVIADADERFLRWYYVGDYRHPDR